MTHWRNRFESPSYASDAIFGLVVFAIAFAIFFVVMMMMARERHITFDERWAPVNMLRPAIHTVLT